MYMFYLVSAVALSTGVSAFAQYDTLSRQRDGAEMSRVEVTAEQQQVISRSLRRQFQIDPSRFPSVPSNSYAALDPGLINLSISVGGLMSLQESSFYISSNGEVLAVLNNGPSSPSSGNGDIEVGIAGVPQHVEGLLSFLHGSDYERGPLINLQIGGHSNSRAQADDVLTGVGGLFAASGHSDRPQEVASVSVDDIITVARLDMNALDYDQTVSASYTESSGHTLQSAGYEPSNFLAMQARILNR